MWRACESHKGDDRMQLMELAYRILESSGFDDSPEDATRTIAHMELASIQYIDEILPTMDNFPIYVKNKKDATSTVGIENVFDVTLTYDDDKQYRFIGTLDALTKNTIKERWMLEDNKTAARLDAGWRAQFELSNQITGYQACAAAVYGFDIFHSRILGVKIKPTNRGEDTWTTYPPARTAEDFQRWGFWFRFTVDMYETYRDDYEHAPRFTHSCNRYFRPCALIPFCGDTADGRAEQWSQMVEAKPSPSERAVESEIDW